MGIQWNSRWRAFEKAIFIYWHCCSKRRKKRDSGTGTALTGTGTSNAKRGSALLVAVPHLLVPVPSGIHGPI